MINKDELFRDSNKAAMTYSKNAIQFSFILNGMAAAAMFANTSKLYTGPAFVFAFGALLAVFCMGGAYIVQCLLTETWRQDKDPIQVYVWSGFISISLFTIEKIRIALVALWLLSILMTLGGFIWAAVY